MPSIDELTMRFEATCEKIQDSIRIIESYTGAEEEFKFNINEAIYNLAGLDINGTENHVNNSIIILEEYQKMLRLEKSRRRLQGEINRAHEIQTLKEELKMK